MGSKFIACRGMQNINFIFLMFLPVLMSQRTGFISFSEVNILPNAKVLEQKKAMVVSIAEKLENSVAGVVVDYSGTSVADDTVLRKELREAGVE